MQSAPPPLERARGDASGSVSRDPGFLLVLLGFTILAAAALSINVVRTTYGIKGDEATYVAMAQSVAYDGDLTFERRDLDRFWQTYQSGPEGIFLKRAEGQATDDEGLFFAKAFIYPLLAAPFARMAGLNGLLFFNILLLALVFVCAYLFAAARLPRPVAVLVAFGFLFASIAPLYAVYLTSDTFNFALAFYAYFCWLYKDVADAHRLPAWLRGPGSDVVAAALLGLAAFSKLINAPLIAPLVALAIWRRQFARGAVVGAVWAAATLACFATNAAITGEFNYQGGAHRRTIYGQFPFETDAPRFDRLGVSINTSAGLIVEELRSSLVGQFGHNIVYFVVGRHFGLVPYYFPGVLILAWALWRRRDLVAWQVLIAGAVGVTALGLLVLAPNTWSGGGGPPGNRYFLGIYPALFFMLPAARSIAPALVLWVGGALFVAPALIDPFVIAKRPWLLAEQGPLRALPVELTMVNDLPVRLNQGRSRIEYPSDPPLLLYFLDQNATRPEEPGIWVTGRARADLIVRVAPPLAGLEVALQAPIGNRVAVTVDGATQTADVTPDAVTRLTFPVDGVSALGAQSFVMTVTTSDGFVPRLRDRASRDPRFLGVAMELSPIVAGPDAPSGLSKP